MNRSPAGIRAPSQPDGARAAQGYAITVTGAASPDSAGEAAFSCPPGQTVLYAAQAAGWDLPYECASGGCQACRAQLLSGQVTNLWPTASGLTDRDRRRGNRILLCQSRPAAACTLRRPAVAHPKNAASYTMELPLAGGSMAPVRAAWQRPGPAVHDLGR